MNAAIAQAIGTFFGSFATDYLGYTGAFIVCGAVTWGFLFLYMLACGGGIEDEPIAPGQDTPPGLLAACCAKRED